MITTAKLERVFVFNHNGQDLMLTDPSLSFSAEQVMNFYSGTYPVLTTAKLEGPEVVKDKMQYRFSATIGTKG